MNDLAFSVIRDDAAKDALVNDFYAKADASFRDEVPPEEFAERFDGACFIVARRDKELAGWITLRACTTHGDEQAADPGMLAMPQHDLNDPDILAPLFRLAAIEAGPEGIIWHSRTTALNRQVVNMTGAVVIRDLFRTWQAPRKRWQTATATGEAIVHSVHAPLSEDLLAKFLDYLKRAGISNCSGETCTTSWTVDEVAQSFSDRDAGGLLMQILEHRNLVVAETYAFVWNDEMMINISEHQAPASGLVAMVAALLQRIPAAYPGIGIATVELQEDERARLEPVLAACGFEDKGPRTLFHLRPRDETSPSR